MKMTFTDGHIGLWAGEEIYFEVQKIFNGVSCFFLAVGAFDSYGGGTTINHSTLVLGMKGVLFLH